MAFVQRDENILIQLLFPQEIMVLGGEKPSSCDSGNENAHNLLLGLIVVIIRILEFALFHFSVVQK